MGRVKSPLTITVGICAIDKQRFEQHFSCYDSPADSDQSSFSSCNFQSYSLLESRYSTKSAFNHMVSISNVSWMCPCRRNSGVKSATFVTYTNTKNQTKQDIKNSQFQPENTSHDCKLRSNYSPKASSALHALSPLLQNLPSQQFLSNRTTEFIQASNKFISRAETPRQPGR